MIVKNIHGKAPISFEQNHQTVAISLELQDETTSALIIEFTSDIKYWRTSEYQWSSTNKRLIANYYSPKIIILENGQKVISNLTIGCWEFNPKKKNELKWVFRAKELAPVLKYNKQGKKSFKTVTHSCQKLHLQLLYTKGSVPEFSRSKVPFSAILSITDHCDFDTLNNINQQLNTLKETDIKITKGFFLNHFSKRSDNISWENEKEVIEKWINEGHEVCYHSLSQSLKNEEVSSNDFYQFEAPNNNIDTWIDHGFQPYNFTLFEAHDYDEKQWVNNLTSKGIKNLWTYIDSGTGGKGIINQLNPEQFTLKNTWDSLKHLKLTSKISSIIRSYFLFYRSDKPELFVAYKKLASNFKAIVYKKQLSAILPFLKNTWNVCKHLFKDAIRWHKIKHKSFPFSSYGAVIFEESVTDKTFQLFQTVEVNNFVDTFNKENINSLINEAGLCIAHTYLSLPSSYHYGKFFNGSEVNQTVIENLNYIAKKIKGQSIWNPTVNELISYFKELRALSFSFNEKNEIIAHHNNLHIRYIDHEDFSN